MLRILKNYNMPLRRVPKGSVVSGVEMSFSGYPGVIYSGDDFTVASSGLTILETTIGRYMQWHYDSIVNLPLVPREQQQGAVAVRVSPGRGAGGGAGHRGQQAGRGRGLLDQHLLQVAAAVIHP